MNFTGDISGGGWVGNVPNMQAHHLVLHMPKAARAGERTAEFLAAVARIAAGLKTTIDEAGAPPPLAITKAEVLAVEQAAHTMQHALRPLSDGSYTFSAMLPPLDHLLMVRAAPPDTPELPALLQRIYDDLQTLRDVCAHTADHFSPERNPVKGSERMFVRAVATAHRDCFGRLPPVRGWFGNSFMPYVGQCVGLTIGHAVVGQVVRGMR